MRLFIHSFTFFSFSLSPNNLHLYIHIYAENKVLHFLVVVVSFVVVVVVLLFLQTKCLIILFCTRKSQQPLSIRTTTILVLSLSSSSVRMLDRLVFLCAKRKRLNMPENDEIILISYFSVFHSTLVFARFLRIKANYLAVLQASCRWMSQLPTRRHLSSFIFFAFDDFCCASMAQGPNADYVFNVVLAGDSDVGKSNLLSRFARNEFSPQSRRAIGVEFAIKKVQIDGKTIQLKLWDTGTSDVRHLITVRASVFCYAGSLAEFMALTDTRHRNVLGALLVYDVLTAASFRSLDQW